MARSMEMLSWKDVIRHSHLNRDVFESGSTFIQAEACVVILN